MPIQKHHTTTLIVSLILLIFAVFFAPKVSADPIRPGTIIYKVLDGQSASDLKAFNALMNSQGLVSERTLEGSGIIIATFDQIGRETAIANILKHSGYVEFAEPDYAVQPTVQPNDVYYGSQWHHQTINSPQAWDVTTGSNSVLVGVCDSGFDTNHPDLVNNLRLDLAFNAQDGSTNIAPVGGHGTGTAGTLGASGNNAIGVAGVNWNVDIIPVRIALSETSSSAYISTMATCIEYSADQGARVVNLSYGGIEYATIDAAAKYLRDRNGLLFMSAGNDTNEFNYPDYTSFVGVGATDQNNNKASFSSFGNYVDLTAPGVSIRTTYPDDTYTYYSGTSFSSPMTAGVTALMVAANPSLTPEQIENGLFSTATDIGAAGDDNVFGHGLVNAQAAVEYALNVRNLFAPTAVIFINQTSLPFGFKFELNALSSNDSDGQIVSYQWDLGDGTTSNEASISHTYAAAGVYQVNLTVTDNDGLTNSSTQTLQVTNQLPIIAIQASALSGPAPLAIDFFSEGTVDNDGQIVSYEWTLGDGTTATGTSISHSYPNAGTYQVTLTVTDNAGGQNAATLVINVIDPFQVIAPSNLTATVDAQTITLNWQDNSSNEARFIIERAMKVRGKYTFAAVAEVAADTTTYIDEMLELGAYRYRVVAENDYDASSSAEVAVQVDTLANVTPPDPEPAPGIVAPSNLSADLNGQIVTLNWSDNSDNETKFKIIRTEKVKASSTITSFSVGAGATRYVDSAGAGTFTYEVQAINATDSSSLSNAVTVRIK